MIGAFITAALAIGASLFLDFVREERRAAVKRMVAAYASSGKHAFISRLLVEFVDDLAVSELHYKERNGQLDIDIKLSWWGKLIPWKMRNVRRRVKKLLP